MQLRVAAACSYTLLHSQHSGYVQGAPVSRPNTPGATTSANSVHVARLALSSRSMTGRLGWLQLPEGHTEAIGTHIVGTCMLGHRPMQAAASTDLVHRAGSCKMARVWPAP
jgi:hypothetical protein